LTAAYQKNMDRHFKEKKENEKMVEYNIGEKIKKRDDVYKEGQEKVKANDSLAAAMFTRSNK
jgi:hypothetical protein